MKRVIVTICSKSKSDDKQPLPARERYLSDHIKFAKKVSEDEGLDLYILSGLYGLISADTMIPDYDYLLIQEDVASLTEKVKLQLGEEKIGEILFYTKPKWETYNEVMKKATEAMDIDLLIADINK